MKQTKTLVLVAIILVGGAVVFFLQRQRLLEARGRVTTLQGQLDQANADLDDAAVQARRLAEVQKTLEQRTADLAALRGEVAQLRKRLTETSNRLVAAQAAAAARPAAAPETPAPAADQPAFAAVTQATLTSGQTLIVGGWPTEPGQRTIALVTPKAPPGGNGMVLIESRFVSLPEAVLSGPGWEAFQNLADGEAASGLFEAGQARQFLAELKATEGVTVTSAPRVTTLNGREARVSTGAPGENRDMVSFLPVLRPDGRTIDLTVSNALFRPSLP